jgi:putative colanic acid biosynthesis glycosyltransferase WcaI
MGDAMLGIVHPCKLYNALAVQAPIIYIGPRPSHVTEILDRLGDGYPSIRVAHGEADILANQIQALREKKADVRRSMPIEVSAAFSSSVLLPELINTLEQLTDGP